MTVRRGVSGVLLASVLAGLFLAAWSLGPADGSTASAGGVFPISDRCVKLIKRADAYSGYPAQWDRPIALGCVPTNPYDLPRNAQRPGAPACVPVINSFNRYVARTSRTHEKRVRIFGHAVKRLRGLEKVMRRLARKMGVTLNNSTARLPAFRPLYRRGIRQIGIVNRQTDAMADASQLMRGNLFVLFTYTCAGGPEIEWHRVTKIMGEDARNYLRYIAVDYNDQVLD